MQNFSDPIVAQIAVFLEGIGIPVVAEPLQAGTLLPGATVRRGALVFDPDTLPYPGDLLHEAGHIAVTDPAVRATLDEIPSNPGEEMAAMAWSYAAALAAEIDPAIVFHEHGYKGGGASLLDGFRSGRGPGVPMLAWYGLTRDPAGTVQSNLPDFPAMARWLR